MSTCESCKYFVYQSELKHCNGCKVWTDFKLNIERLPIDTRCPSCGGYQPVTPNEFVSEIQKTGPKNFTIHCSVVGNIKRYDCVVVSKNSTCMFYKGSL